VAEASTDAAFDGSTIKLTSLSPCGLIKLQSNYKKRRNNASDLLFNKHRATAFFSTVVGRERGGEKEERLPRGF
jgi:hypothetical protein